MKRVLGRFDTHDIGFEAAPPFSGCKQSGWDGEMGREVLEYCTQAKASMFGL